jgi:hypothetical protein
MKRWPWMLFLLGLALIYVVGPSMHSVAQDGIAAAQVAASQPGEANAKAAQTAGGILDGLNYTLYGLTVQIVGFLISAIALLIGLLDVVRHVRRSLRPRAG